MARSSGRTGKRDSRTITNDPLSALLTPTVVPTVIDAPVTLLSEVDDLRTWHPDRMGRSVRTLAGTPARVQAATSGRAAVSPAVPVHVSFRSPSNVVECVRRSQRREVLFATRKFRKGSGSAKRRSWRSNIRCK